MDNLMRTLSAFTTMSGVVEMMEKNIAEYKSIPSEQNATKLLLTSSLLVTKFSQEYPKVYEGMTGIGRDIYSIIADKLIKGEKF